MSPSKSKSRVARAPCRDEAAPQLSSAPEAAPHELPSIPVVAIGASAGGLDAFKQFFDAMPADSGLAFVLIQHLDPAHKSHTAELLASHTAMPVISVQAPIRLAANQVYVIPAAKYLTIQAGELQLTEPVLYRGVQMPIDYFFRALADAQREKAIGIILSGTGSDGTLGLKAIKDGGGLVVAQSPETAEYDGMPKSAVATGLVDDVRPVNAMPELLLEYVAHAYIKSASEPPALTGEALDQLLDILTVLSTRTQYDFRPYKKGALMPRIERRMSLHHLETLLDYRNLLRQDASEAHRLCKDLLIGVTGFPRDPGAADMLLQQLEAELTATKEDLRITIADHAVAAEELKLANKELKTSKKELQSLNEELTTLNGQLQAKLVELETTSNDLANLLSSTDIPTLFLDPQLRIKRFTPATTQLFNLIATDVDRPLRDLATRVNDCELQRDTAAVLAELIPREQELHTDDDRWYIRRALPYRTQDNRINGVVVTFVDITQRKRAEIAAQQAQYFAESIVETVREPLLILDETCRVITANAAYYQMFRAMPKETEQVLLTELGNGQWNLPELRRRLEEVVRGDAEFNNYEIEYDFPVIGTKTMVLNARTIKLPLGQPKRVLLAVEDVTKARQLSAQLIYDAHHDALTGLANRREFEHRLARILENAKNTRSEHVLIYLDLDQFKVINDSCGHAAGDELLRQLGAVLYEHIRGHDVLARLGGDEFGVLLEHCTLAKAQRIGEMLRKAVEAFPFVWWENQVFKIGVSLGVVAITADAGDVDTILKAADAACYMAKDNGRNRLHVYRETDALLAERHGQMQWVTRLRHALEDGRLQLYSQPIMPLHGNRAGLHYELLLRLEDEDGKLVLPGAFLPASEHYSLVTQLDRWVVQAAANWLSSEPEHLARLTLCCINLSAHSIVDERFLAFVLDHIQQRELPAQKLCFEITETSVITNLARATRFIKALKEQGCGFALDDFGTGFTSFAHLKALPVDFLKIDGSFVRSLIDDPVSLAVVQSINDIGQTMGKQTIAESVENDAILAKLRTLGIDYAQGNAIGRPQPLAVTTLESDSKFIER